MAWYPIAFLPPQYQVSAGAAYSGAVLKAYEAQTNNIIPMATSYLGTTTAESFPLNAAGYPTSGGMVIIPHISQNYKLALYPTQAAADADSGAVWTVDDIQIAALESNAFVQYFSGDGVTTSFVLSEDLGVEENALMIFADKAFEEYTTNGSMATDTGWTKGAGWTIAAGVADAAGAISTDLTQTVAIPILEGESYTIKFTITRSAGGVIPKIGGTSGTERTSAGTYSETLIAGSSQALTFSGNGFTGTVDNITVHRTSSAHREILRPNEYTVNGTALSLTNAPATGTQNIIVFAPALLLGAVSSYVAQAALSETNALNSANAAAQALADAQDALADTEDARDEAQAFRNQADGFAVDAQGFRDEAEGFKDDAEAAAATFTVTGTSVSNVSVGSGSKTYATQTGRSWVPGATRLRIATADGTKINEGVVTAYSAGNVTINSDYTVGSGSASAWNIDKIAERGASGAGAGDVVAANYGTEYSANYAAFRSNIGLAIGTAVQAYSAKLAAIVGLSWAADKLIVITGAATAALVDTAEYGLSLLAAADAAALRTLAGLGTASILDSDTDGTLAANSDVKIATQKATKTYVDANASGSYKLLGTRTASNSSSLDFTSLITSDYSEYEFEFDDIRPATSGEDFIAQTSTNNGSSYSASGGNYSNSGSKTLTTGSSSASTSAVGGDSATSILIGSMLDTTATLALSGSLKLFNPLGTTSYKKTTSHSSYSSSAGGFACMVMSGMRNNTADVDAIRFKMTSGNITSGVIRMYGKKNT